MKSLENKSSRRRLRKSLISNLMKRKERKIPKNKNRNNIINYKSSKQKLTINVKEKKRRSMNEKFNSKSKWEISKSKIRPKERKLKKRKRIISIIYLYKRLRRKLLNKKERHCKENWKRDKDSNKLWNKTTKINAVLNNKLNVKEFR